MTDCIVIFGAAVREDGTASGSLRRRCDNAAHYAERHAARHGPAAGGGALLFMPSGGVGRFGPAEAVVMRDILLDHGIAAERIVLEAQARDTLESVRLCTRLLRRRPEVAHVLVATSSYHRLRCTWLFRAAGFACDSLPTASDRPYIGWAKWLRYVAKECLVTPWDLAWLLFHRMRRNI